MIVDSRLKLKFGLPEYLIDFVVHFTLTELSKFALSSLLVHHRTPLKEVFDDYILFGLFIVRHEKFHFSYICYRHRYRNVIL